MTRKRLKPNHTEHCKRRKSVYFGVMEDRGDDEKGKACLTEAIRPFDTDKGGVADVLQPPRNRRENRV